MAVQPKQMLKTEISTSNRYANGKEISKVTIFLSNDHSYIEKERSTAVLILVWHTGKLYIS